MKKTVTIVCEVEGAKALADLFGFLGDQGGIAGYMRDVKIADSVPEIDRLDAEALEENGQEEARRKRLLEALATYHSGGATAEELAEDMGMGGKPGVVLLDLRAAWRRGQVELVDCPRVEASTNKTIWRSKTAEKRKGRPPGSKSKKAAAEPAPSDRQATIPGS